MKAIFGKDFDFSKLTGKYTKWVNTPDFSNNETILSISDPVTNTNYSLTSSGKVFENGDGSYSYFFLHTEVVKTLPDGITKDQYYEETDENGQVIAYHLHDHCAVLTVEQKNDFWVIKSYEGRPLSDWYAAEEAGHTEIPPK